MTRRAKRARNLQIAWGDLTSLGAKGVLPAALSELGLGSAPRAKHTGYCEFQTAIIRERQLYWNDIASRLSDNPVLGGENPPARPRTIRSPTARDEG